ncbi:MAG: histidine kinase [Candidatus Marinimicrobia bacterium]|nr:histidine kinase [Candidatus Neomarinimicrobiota bacterium]
MSEVRLNIRQSIEDASVRLIMIPLLGILIPNLTGLFAGVEIGSPWYWTGYIYFIFLSYCLWQGNRYILLKQREHWNWFRHPVRKVLMLLSANVLYTAPLTICWIYLWYQFPPFTRVDWNAIYLVSLMNVIAVIFITHIYETVFLIKERQDDLVQVEQLKRTKVQAELDALKNQIDPHFVFNSLNTLTYLVEVQSEKALLYLENLAETYRYMLANKEKDFVKLGTEIRFFRKYFSLIKIRYESAIRLIDNISQHETADYLIPPISLQLLLENAVKHNEFSEEDPLRISLQLNEKSLLVSNPYRPKSSAPHSQKIGLTNIGLRYQLLTGRKIHVRAEDGIFSVELPVLKTRFYENTSD